jgi:flagellin
MTRINTNVSSLNAQKTLARSNASLQQSLTRLSTGLRINVGKDDPAGLIASEALRADITAVNRAISNSQRANQMIATSESALGQAAALLNDIRGLVTEAANTGALSDEQIAANQLQVDSSLEALNRIAQTTTFQGRKLLDGSLDFITTAGSISTIEDVQIEQANLGAAGEIDVSVDISSAATRASLTSTGFSAADTASATLTFAAGDLVTFANGGAGVSITGRTLSSDLSGVQIDVQTSASVATSAPTVVYDADASTLTITINDSANTDDDALINAINNQTTEFYAASVTAGAISTADAGAAVGTTGTDSIAIEATSTGPDYNDVQVNVATSTAANPSASYDSLTRTLTLTINNSTPTSVSDLANAINNLSQFSAVATTNGTTTLDPTQADPDATTNTGTTGGRTLLADLTIEIGGKDGAEAFNFQSGAAINQLVDAVNLVSDSTGVEALYDDGTLTLRSAAYGSDAFVSANVISEGTGGLFENTLSALRDTGSDIVATVNGVSASGDGNTFSINTSVLDLSITVSDGSSTAFNFDITGGGALFQLGPEVVTSQQARLGIGSLNTAQLGGEHGRLYQLASGGSAALASDPALAESIVDEVIDQVASLRGRLGAFQRTTLDTNIASLSDTLENLTEAESSIRDADFAVETAALTRAQILVQSGLSVLAIANSNPQNVLALLR